jgi:serine/threonine-protein kinase
MPFEPPLTSSELQPCFVGQYDIEQAVQTGGQGVVFRARPTGGSAGPTVALKIYHADQLEERLEREINVLKTIRAPTLVELHGSGTCAVRGVACRFLATTFIDGRPLDQALASDGPLALDRVARVGHDVARAVEAIWAARVVHRDLKPNNIMLTPSGQAVVIDLGIARHLDQKTLTTGGKTWGTVGYFSPEQVRGAPLTCKSDVFALGIVLQECILGRHPTSLRQQLLLAGGVKTDGLRPNLPRFLVHLIDAMVAKNPIIRPAPSAVALGLTRLAGLFEIGGKRLLFPGDAQIENWSYALSKEKYRKLVAGVTLYKVGHHGSLNATPKKSLWSLFKNRSMKKTKSRLQTLVSTLPDKHGHPESGTEVPRKKLVAALTAETDYFTTQSLTKKDELCAETRISFK